MPPKAFVLSGWCHHRTARLPNTTKYKNNSDSFPVRHHSDKSLPKSSPIISKYFPQTTEFVSNCETRSIFCFSWKTRRSAEKKLVASFRPPKAEASPQAARLLAESYFILCKIPIKNVPGMTVGWASMALNCRVVSSSFGSRFVVDGRKCAVASVMPSSFHMYC